MQKEIARERRMITEFHHGLCSCFTVCYMLSAVPLLGSCLPQSLLKAAHTESTIYLINPWGKIDLCDKSVIRCKKKVHTCMCDYQEILWAVAGLPINCSWGPDINHGAFRLSGYSSHVHTALYGHRYKAEDNLFFQKSSMFVKVYFAGQHLCVFSSCASSKHLDQMSHGLTEYIWPGDPY